MSDLPEQSSSRDDHETINSPPVLVINSTAGVQEHIIRDPPETSGSLQEHENTGSLVPAGHLSPIVLTATPVMSQTLEPGTQPPTEGADSCSQDSNPSQTSPPASNPTLTFPIMELPPELRLMVFDQLFLDLTVRRQRSMTHHNEEKLLQKYQVNDFRPYTNLLLTCKELNKEAKNHWDKYYLRECCFYFWHVSKLYDLALVLAELGDPYTEIKYVLRSQFAHNYISTFCPAPTFAELGLYEAEWFIETQPGAAPGYEELDDHFSQRIYTTIGKTSGIIEVGEGTYEATENNPVRVVVHKEAGRTFARGDHLGPESCAVSVHQDDTTFGGCIKSESYTQMQGTFSGIFWGGYDPAVGYGKLKLWEAMPLDHLQGHCGCDVWNIPENRFADDDLLWWSEAERLTLMNKWYDEIIVDRKWLALGGQVDERGAGVTDLMEGYDMNHWLNDDYWRQRADDYWVSWRISDAEWRRIEESPDLRPPGEWPPRRRRLLITEHGEGGEG
jgi:hypothetical protein